MNPAPETDFLTIAFSIFFVLNATGQIPLFLALLGKFPHHRQIKIIIRELCIALLILVLFTFFGDWLLKVMGISQPVIAAAGGILLFLISLTMIFPSKEAAPTQELSHEPIIIPLAIPVITGPGAITTVMSWAHNTGRPALVAAAAFSAWLPSLIIILLGSYIKRILGERGLIAVERLGGMLVCLIGINMFATGAMKLVQEFFQLLPK